MVRFHGQDKLRIIMPMAETEDRVAAMEKVLGLLT